MEYPSRLIAFEHVALRKESVDRNSFSAGRESDTEEVALRKESVDRNIKEDVL